MTDLDPSVSTTTGSSAAIAPATEEKTSPLNSVLKSDQLGVGSALVGLIVLMALIAPYFWTTGNLLEVMRQVSAIAILAAGGTFVILTAGIDLSVGSALGFCAMVAIVSADNGLNPLTAIVLSLAAGVLIGLVNGVITAFLALPAFIVTLAALTYLRGFVYVGTEGTTVIPSEVAFDWIGQSSFLGGFRSRPGSWSRSTQVAGFCSTARCSAARSTPSAATPRPRGSAASAFVGSPPWHM